MLRRTQNTRNKKQETRSKIAKHFLLVSYLLFLVTSPTASLSAGWFGKKKLVQQPASAAAAGTNGYAVTIRRMQGEAQAAADRGDHATAGVIAERAHKLALTCQHLLTDSPDCSPEQTAEFARRFAPAVAPYESREAELMSASGGVADGDESSSPAVPETLPLGLAKPRPILEASRLDQVPLRDANSIHEEALIPPSPVPPLPEASRPKMVAAKSPAERTEPGRSSTAEVGKGMRTTHFASQHTQDRLRPAESRLMTSRIATARPVSGDNYLALRSDWLNEQADLNQLIRRLNTDSESETVGLADSFDSSELDEPVVKQEVTTAIGRGEDSYWELDESAANADAASGAPPQLRDGPVATEDVADSPDALVSVKEVVTLPEFFGPAVADVGPSSEPQLADVSPQMIETAFHLPATVEAPPPPAETETDSDGGNRMAEVIAAPLPAPDAAIPASAAVSYREDAALDWLPVAESAPMLRSEKPAALRQIVSWLGETTSKQALAGGLVLVLCGLVLFAVSFRWS